MAAASEENLEKGFESSSPDSDTKSTDSN